MANLRKHGVLFYSDDSAKGDEEGEGRKSGQKLLPLSDRVRERFGWGDSFGGWAGAEAGS